MRMLDALVLDKDWSKECNILIVIAFGFIYNHQVTDGFGFILKVLT